MLTGFWQCGFVWLIDPLILVMQMDRWIVGAVQVLDIFGHVARFIGMYIAGRLGNAIGTSTHCDQ